ncbi:hypothetical protein KC343_g14182 [Hortaea werneckii]|uniref:Transcription factor TFIIIC triple barrel domain-containing protein n=1 Tax=Hortaea werneckii TaxID=91943 RepID=A0A3M7FLC7_HORWE|nr:hypothetical protein KC352_g26002 [Hortaea werneckii]KAI7550155.1 hypothetical protein KC317_g14363 [Hortaea werneckii]KAI7598804.1 hypothetical protein KC346_g14057 [Hortaea werneckii]KAI7604244.1 hypothetical protein KC343_g14182 [Hortaea werneckii]KAI7640461.1 hypothetical protein KC319_g13978 [Hortaea werneckii]
MASGDDTGGDDVQWEYEYDDNETEDFYLTLDLTTHVSNAVATPEPRKRNRAAPKGKRRPETTAEQSAREERDAAVPAVTTARLPSLPAAEADGEEQFPTATQEAKLQILDLHSDNPFVKFVDGVYSCNWHTDLSTQVYVARPGVTELPLRPGNVVDVVGLSRRRLVGKPVTLQPRPKPVSVETEPLLPSGDDENHPSSQDVPTTTTTTIPPHSPPAAAAGLPPSSDFSHVRPGDPLTIPRDRVRNEAMEQQASFLEQLSAIKLKRGETDLVPVSGVRYYDPPADREGIRARALAVADSERGSRSGASGEAGDDEGGVRPPSAKRRRMSGRRGGGDDEDDDDYGGGGRGGVGGDGLRFRNQTVETFSRPKTNQTPVAGQLEQHQQAQPGAATPSSPAENS